MSSRRLQATDVAQTPTLCNGVLRSSQEIECNISTCRLNHPDRKIIYQSTMIKNKTIYSHLVDTAFG